MKTEDLFIVGFALVVLVIIIVFGVGALCGRDAERQRAVKAGVARYFLDENNEKTFDYKTNLVERVK